MKKNIAFSFLGVVVAMFIAVNANATNGMRMIGFGPVQDSMGGVSVGLPLDAASVLTNPAGMSDSAWTDRFWCLIFQAFR